MSDVTTPSLPPRQRAVRSDKSPARVAVEAALQAAHPEALTKLQLAARCDFPTDAVQKVLGNLCTTGHAHRLPPGGAETAARFGWGGKAACQAPTAPSGREAAGQSIETPSPAPLPARAAQPVYSCRPGAMDAFTLPSLRNGRREERRAPVSIGCTPSPRARS